MKAWRLVCSTTRWRASIRTIARVGGRRAGDHVARVLHVPGRVGEDERALRRGEVAVGDVDRDPLLALGPQAVGEQRQVQRSVAARRLDASATWSSWSLEDRLGVVEQAPDQRRLAVSTEPAVARRNRPDDDSAGSEVSGNLPVLHRGF